MARTVLIQVMILSLMILLGYVLGRRGYITASHSEFLTKLVLDVFFPCSVIAAASSGFDDGNRWQTLGVAAFYYASLIAFTAVAYLIGGILKLEPDRRLIFCSGAAYPNNAFLGMPLCTAVFGQQGALWAALSIPGTTLYIFTVLTPTLRRKREDIESGESRLRALFTPLNLSAVAMIVMLLFGWEVAGPLYTVCNSFGTCTTPAAMLLIGYLLSRAALADAFRRPVIFATTLLRNFLCPLMGAAALRFTPWDRQMCLCLVVIMGCSVAATVSIFAARYKCAQEFAGQSMLQSTLLLPLTMPLMTVFAERILT